MKKPKIGDVYEIKTPIGLAYVQYTHDGQDMGQLVRVLPGTYDSRPHIPSLAKQKELYFVFYTLEYALRAKQINIVSNQPIPEWANEFPLMRKSGGRDAEGRTLNWTIAPANKLSTLEDLKQALRVYELSPDHRKLSIHLLCPHPALVRDIVRGWTPERDEELNLLARKSKTESVVSEPAVKKALEHYLYFPRKTEAKKAGKRLEAKGWLVEVRMGADGENWLVLAKQPAPISEGIDEIRDELERLAAELHGEYDGWGAAV